MQGTPAEVLDWGLALVPTSIANGGTANGARIINPGKWGKYLIILLSNAGLTGITAATIKLQGSLDNGTTWADVLQNDGVTVLSFTGAKFIAAGTYDGKVALGSIDLSRYHYKDYRIVVSTNTGATVLWSAVYVVAPIREKATRVQYPSIAGLNQYGQDQASGGNVDEWLNNTLGVGATL